LARKGSIDVAFAGGIEEDEPLRDRLRRRLQVSLAKR